MVVSFVTARLKRSHGLVRYLHVNAIVIHDFFIVIINTLCEVFRYILYSLSLYLFLTLIMLVANIANTKWTRKTLKND